MKIVVFCLFLFPFIGFTQIPGENIFGTNQVIRVDITFNQTGFWDSLVANYVTETNMMAIGLKVTDNLGEHIMDSIEIRLKGNSSYGHPGNKKSFKIDVNKFVQGQSYDGLKKLNFNNCFKDPTLMREKVFFDLCNSIGVPSPRVTYANVYMNGTFWGFYNMVEQIDDQFLDWAILDDNGNLFKAGDNSNGQTPADLMYYGPTQSSYETRYELKTNTVSNDWTDLIALLDYINNSSSSVFASNFNVNFNKTKLLQSFVLDNLFSSLDSYLNSARNYYIYHNDSTGQWDWIKWDGNEAFGLYTGGPGLGNLQELAPNYIAGSRPLVSKIFADAALYQDYIIEMCDILGAYFNSTYMNAKINEIKTLIEPHVTADNNKMYTTQNFIDNIEQDIQVSGGPQGNQTVFGLKSFVAARNSYLFSVISCEAKLSENIFNTIVYPNPFEKYFILNSDINIKNIVDITGKEIDFKLTNVNHSNQIEVIGEPGIYFVQIELENQIKRISLVKE
jgi:spore coat protein H